MSYALGQTSGGVTVGSRAPQDLILARASLAAAKLLLRAAKRPRAARPAFIARAVGRKYGAKARREYEARPHRTDQQVYDALRLALANYYTVVGLRWLQGRLKAKHGSRFTPVALSGLGDEGRDIGCAIGGGATALLAGIVGIYTGGAGTPLVGAGGTLAMTAAGCSTGQAGAQGDLAAAEAAAAAAALEAARLEAEAAERKRKKMITIAAIAGASVLVLGVGYMIVK